MLRWDVPVKFLLHIALAPWACLSVELTLLSLLLLLSEAAASRKLCWVNLSYWLPDIKVAQFSFEEDVNSYLTKFSKQMPLSNYLWCPMMNKKNHLFLYSTYQDCMIFAKIGDGSCWYLWNEICAGVVLEKNIKMHSKNWASMVFLFWMNGRSHVFFELSSTLMFFWPICISSILNQDWSKFSHSATLILL